MASLSSNLRLLLRHGDLWLIAGLFGTVMLLILPVAPWLLDGLLAISIAMSLLTLLVILYVRQPSDFSSRCFFIYTICLKTIILIQM